MFNTESAATEALNQSPIRYRLTPVSSNSEGPSEESLDSEQPGPSNPEPDAKIFELHVSTSTFDHDKYLNSPSTNPLHGSFRPVTPKNSYIASSLHNVIAPSLWAPGLKDWETDGFGSTDQQQQDPELRPAQGTMRTNIEQRVARRERKRQAMALPEIMKGIRPLREAYEREQERSQSSNDG